MPPLVQHSTTTGIIIPSLPWAYDCGRMIVGVWFGRMICTYGFAGAHKLLGVWSAKQERVKHKSIPPYEIENSIIKGIYTF